MQNIDTSALAAAKAKLDAAEAQREEVLLRHPGLGTLPNVFTRDTHLFNCKI